MEFKKGCYWRDVQRNMANSQTANFRGIPGGKMTSPSDTVLLFETDEGWNQFGGPELLTTQRNKEEGCYVLLNNKGPQFISKRRKLKWKPDESQEE